MNQPHTKAIDVVYVDESDLPVYCPGPNSPLWSMHPRVYIEIETTKKAHCPYCGAQQQLRTPPATGANDASGDIAAPYALFSPTARHPLAPPLSSFIITPSLVI